MTEYRCPSEIEEEQKIDKYLEETRKDGDKS